MIFALWVNSGTAPSPAIASDIVKFDPRPEQRYGTLPPTYGGREKIGEACLFSLEKRTELAIRESRLIKSEVRKSLANARSRLGEYVCGNEGRRRFVALDWRTEASGYR